MLDKIQIYVSIIAALAIVIMGIIEKMALPQLTVRLIWVIILFYFAGLIIRNYIKTNIFPEPKEEISQEDAEADTKETQLPEDTE